MRIAGVTIPEQKHLDTGLMTLYGIGRQRARLVLRRAGVPYTKKPPELSTQEEQVIRKAIEEFKIEGDLKREIAANVKRLKDIKCYRGTRHAKGLPVRGQRTRTNSRTRRGNVRKTMGTGRRRLEKR